MNSYVIEVLQEDEMSDFFVSIKMGFWRANLENKTVSLITPKLLGLESNQLSFNDFASYLKDETTDFITTFFESTLDAKHLSKLVHIDIGGTISPVCFYSIKRQANSSGEHELWGYFRVFEKEANLELEIQKNMNNGILMKQNRISQAILKFVKSHDLDANVNSILKDVVDLYDVDRIYVNEYNLSGTTTSCIYEAVKEGISKEIDNLQNIPVDYIPWWTKQVKSNSIIALSTLDDLPEEASNERELLGSQGIKSLLVMPIHSKDNISYCLGIDMVRKHVKWSDEDLIWFSSIVNLFSVFFEFNKSEIEIIKAKDKALEMDKLKSAFLANMSHEIRTPLNSIVGFSNMLAEDGRGSISISKDDKIAFSSIINKNSDLLLQLINDILDVSKIEAGIIDIRYSEIDIKEIYNMVYQSFEPKIKKGVSYLLDIPDENTRFICDRNRLVQLLTNFMSNAIKFTFTGQIVLGYKLKETCIRFFVSDTGIGIDKEKLNSIFNNFVKLNSYVQGTGLGLSICKSIANRLNGDIGVDSEKDVGSTFWVDLPYGLNLKCSNEPQEFTNSSLNEDITVCGKPRILIAEDNESNFILLSSMLKSQYTIEWARNGIEVIDRFKKKTPNLILMDIKMPIMDGIEATRIIRELNESVPIIAVTAYAYDTDKVKAFEAGCNDFLFKPIHSIDLMRKINTFIS